MALRKLIDRATHLPLGFIHLPHLPQEAAGRGPAGASMPLSTMRESVTLESEKEQYGHFMNQTLSKKCLKLV